jgi:hypothetical protein
MSTRAEAWDLARDLVVRGGQTYAEVAAATGLPLSTVQKRAARENWKAEADTATDYSARVRALKNKALDAALAGNDPQLFYAWQAMERAWPEHRYTRAQNPAERREVAATVVEQLVAYLADVDRNVLAALQPHILPFAKHLEVTWAA